PKTLAPERPVLVVVLDLSRGQPRGGIDQVRVHVVLVVPVRRNGPIGLEVEDIRASLEAVLAGRQDVPEAAEVAGSVRVGRRAGKRARRSPGKQNQRRSREKKCYRRP